MDESGTAPDGPRPPAVSLKPAARRPVHPAGGMEKRAGRPARVVPPSAARFPHRPGRAPALAHMMHRNHCPRSRLTNRNESLSRLLDGLPERPRAAVRVRPALPGWSGSSPTTCTTPSSSQSTPPPRSPLSFTSAAHRPVTRSDVASPQSSIAAQMSCTVSAT